MSKFNRERAARVLVEAAAIGNDRKAAERLGISDRSIRNYRKALDEDPELAALFQAFAEEEAKGWHLARVRALRIANQRAVALLEVEADLDKVTRFIEKTGGTDLAAEVLGVSRVNPQQGPGAPEAASGPAAEGPGASEEDDSGGSSG